MPTVPVDPESDIKSYHKPLESCPVSDGYHTCREKVIFDTAGNITFPLPFRHTLGPHGEGGNELGKSSRPA